MTVTASVAGPPSGAGAATQVRRRAVWGLAVAVGIAALVALALSTAAPDQLLDPDGAGPSGGKALVEVLRDHGVEVEVVRSAQALADADPGPGTTVLVGSSDYLGHDSAQLLADSTARADRLVLVSPSADQLEWLGLPLTSSPVATESDVTAGCRSTVARADDTATVVDVRFVPVEHGDGPPAVLCFALPNPRADGDATPPEDFGFGAAMATVPAAGDHPEVVALGMGTGFTNRRIDEASHAAVAVRALGHSARLVWYQPGIGDLVSEGGDGPSPWPRWLAPAVAVLATAVVVLAFVRGRRLGALVTEPLPVVVRAVETTESRGRIYRRARDRERAAAVLRLGSTERLARRLALPPAPSTQARTAVHAAAAAASGLPPAQVAALLTGPVPTTDAELHTLANDLADLEERVRTS